MADIPDINPSKPIWPVRPDERNQPRRERRRGTGSGRDKDEHDKRKDGDGDGHIDEFA